MTQPSATSRLEWAIQEFFSEFRRPRAFLWAGVSGGCDSVMLLHTLHRMHRKGRIPVAGLGVVHVNHALRGEESDGDEAFVRDLAGKLDVPFECFRMDWPEEASRSQAACRERRSDFFRALVERTAPCYLALAHHENDLAETVMQRLMRGTGLAGLAAMRPVNGVRIRPWLKVPQPVIRAAAEEQGISWREDSSNLDTKYERNWVRHELLPLMERRRTGSVRHLAALALEAAELARSRPLHLLPLAVVGDSRFFSLASLREADSALLHKVFRLDRGHTLRLSKFLRTKNLGRYPAPGLSIQISCGLVLLDPRSQPDLPPPRREGSVWESVLGRWTLLNESREFIRDGARSRGRLKKLQVPIWFRESVPCLARADGAVEPLVPPRWFEPWSTKEWSFQPCGFSRKVFLQRSSGRTSEYPPREGRSRR